MLDWLSSKVALSVAALLLLASAGGAFELVKARNAERMLEECAREFSQVLWTLNASGEGSTALVARRDPALPAEVLGDPLMVKLYPGLLVLEAGDRSASARIPMLLDGGGAGAAPWSGDSFYFVKRGGCVVLLESQPPP